MLIYSTNQSNEITPDPVTIDTETPNTEVINGESGYITGQISARSEIVYMYANELQDYTIAGKPSGDTNDLYTSDTKAKEYGTITANSTVKFVEDTDSSQLPDEIRDFENIGYSEQTISDDIKVEDVIDVNANKKLHVNYTFYKREGENTVQLKDGDFLKSSSVSGQSSELIVVAEFDKYLAKSAIPCVKIDNNELKLEINDSIQMEQDGSVQVSNSNYTTKIKYKYPIKSGDEFDINKLTLHCDSTIYVIDSDFRNNPTNNPPTLFNFYNEQTVYYSLRVDGICPSINTKIYVENELESGRYTAGKEVLIEMTTSEEIQEIEELPEVKVKFSKSGDGKYNYKGYAEGSGYAKPINGFINNDEQNGKTTTIIYSYQIQDGDEGNIEIAYIGEIIDLAGNITDLNKYSQFIAEDTTDEVNLNKELIGYNKASGQEQKKNINFKLYKGTGESKEEIIGTTYISNDDTITIEATIDGFIYTRYVNGTEGNGVEFLTTDTVSKIPSLRINSKEANPISITNNKNLSTATTIGTTGTKRQFAYDDAKTTITYSISGNKFNYEGITKLEAIEFALKSDLYISNRYATGFASSGQGSEELLDIGGMNNVVTKIPNSSNSNIEANIEGLNIYSDPIGVADTFEGMVYADTTKPTVSIIPDVRCDFNQDGVFNSTDIELLQMYLAEMPLDLDSEVAAKIKNNILEEADVNNDNIINLDDATKMQNMLLNIEENNKVIKYKFVWSEKVLGFDMEDIIVNGGTKLELSEPIEKDDGLYVYTMIIKPNVTMGNVGDLQVVVEQDAVTDLAYHGNIRNESLIRIDKKAPRLINYSYNYDEQNKKIIVDVVFDEEIYSVYNENRESGLEIKVGGFEADGYYEDPIVLKEGNKNKVRYTYLISGVDGGNVEIRLKDKVEDKFGNLSDEFDLTIPNSLVLQKNVIKDNNIEYSFKKNNNPISDFSHPTYFKVGDKIIVTKNANIVTTYEHTITTDDENGKGLFINLNNPENGNVKIYSQEPENIDGYIDISSANIYVDTINPIVTTKVEPVNPKSINIYSQGEELTIIATSNEKVTENTIPEISVKFDIDNTQKSGVFNDGEAQYIEKIENENGTTSWKYRYVISEGDEGTIKLSYKSGKITDLADNSTVLTSLNDTNSIFILNDIAVDATKPTVSIIAKKKVGNTKTDITGNVTNANEIEYTFTWSEKVTGFVDSDITINNGRKVESLSAPVEDTTSGKVSYTMLVAPSVENGNTGDIQVIIEQDAVKDIVGHGNVRTENVIRVDKQAPILISLEAKGHSNIDISNVDTVKQYYKAGDTVEIIATFSENIENSTVPTLSLQFSESGNAKGTVSAGIKSANKITYTYTVTNEDKGLLSVKGFGKVVNNVPEVVKDKAGNETIVVKRELAGDTIIADTKAPTLVSLTAIAPSFEYNNLVEQEPKDSVRYGVESKTRDKNTITIIAEYSENVYNLVSNTTMKNITKEDNNAPTLKLKFVTETSTGTERTATFDRIEGNKLYYTYDISDGDNGDLRITSLNGKVSDLAGNTLTLTTNTSLPGLAEYIEETKLEGNNHIVADTTKPSYTMAVIEAIDKDDNGNEITGNNVGRKKYFRQGSIITITITATSNEFIYKNNNKELTCFKTEDAPELTVKFNNIAGRGNNGKAVCTKFEYSGNNTVFTYEYIVEDQDNGELTASIAADTGYDIALNGNNAKTQIFTDIIADTERPYIAENTNRVSQFEIESTSTSITATGIFSEQLYYKDENNNLIKLTSNEVEHAPRMGVIADGKLHGLATAHIETETETGVTKLVYTYNISNIDAQIVSVNIIDGTLYDVAGNEWSLDIKSDTASPRFSEIQVLTPDGYYNKDKTLEFAVKFVEQTKLTTVPTLKIKIGDKAIDLTGTVDEEDELNQSLIKVARYSYKIVDENGPVTIVSLIGSASDGNRSSTVNEEYTGTNDRIKDYKENVFTNTTESKVIVDTIHPTVEITSNVEKTNKNKVVYTFTWSEPVSGFNADDIEVINGVKSKFTGNDGDTVYTLEVNSTQEGRQIVNVQENACVDRAGNNNTENKTYNNVVIDYTKPEIRAKVNGGKFVINTDPEPNTDKRISKLKETIVVNEEISEFKFKWSTSTTVPEEDDTWTTIPNNTLGSNSDIPVNTEVTETGTYYLYMKVTDIAGNTFTGRTNGFVVNDATITITTTNTNITNQDVTLSVNYGTGLTENRRAGIQGKTQSADSTKVILTENGVVYAEATDTNGNKVYATLTLNNIDKTAPKGTITYETLEDGKVKATISFNEENVTVTNNSGSKTYTFEENGEFTFEFVDNAGNRGTSKATVTSIHKDNPQPQPEPQPEPQDTTAPEITFNYSTTSATVGTRIGSAISTNEDAKISYKWNDGNWKTSNDYIRSYNITYLPATAGTYKLYAKAIDKSGNETVKTLVFTIVNSEEEITIPEIEFEELTVLQKNGVKYVRVSPTFTTAQLTEKMNVQKLHGKTPSYNKLTSDNKLKTGSEITLDGETKYVVIVNGDVNCDGKVDFINDIIMINNYRIGKNNNLSEIQKIAGDINNSGTIEFISDIIAINYYRLGKTNTL